MGRRPEEDVLTDPDWLACAQDAIDTIQRLELWRVFRKHELDDGGIALELGGAWRLIVREQSPFPVEEWRDLDTGKWIRGETNRKRALLPDMSLRAVPQSALRQGRNVLVGVGNWAANHHLERLEARLGAVVVKTGPGAMASQIEDADREHKKNQVRWLVRQHLYSNNKHHHIQVNWQHFAKAAWAIIDREALGLMLRTRFREPFGLRDYLRMLPEHEYRARLAAISSTLLPWERTLDERGRYADAIQCMEQGQPIPRGLTGYGRKTCYTRGRLGADIESRTMQDAHMVDWRRLAEQSFSFVYAMCRLEPICHAPFLAAWCAQEPALKTQCKWLIQHAAQAPTDCNWCLEDYRPEHWTALMQIMLEQGRHDQIRLGYDTVVRTQWRREFFNQLHEVGEHWYQSKQREDGVPPGRLLSHKEKAYLLPEGALKARYNEMVLDENTAQAPIEKKRAGFRL